MALAVAMILLLVVTLVGLAAVSGTLMQQKMSANFYDRQTAFQSTEAAMRQAALAIQATTTAAPAGFYDCSTPAGSSTAANSCLSNPFVDTNVPSSNITTVATTAYNAGNMVASKPQYIVQYMGNFPTPVPPVKQTSHTSYGGSSAKPTADFYRVTARSGDPTVIGGRAYVVLQSVFRN
ncbi:pilus assembly protein [Rhodanobacter sp. 7MK24]|nr:pilus assembly protein [Rhodanobacter sp. 7MK24]